MSEAGNVTEVEKGCFGDVVDMGQERLNAGPAIAIGELGDCLGRQMGWGRPLVSPLDLLPINHS